MRACGERTVHTLQGFEETKRVLVMGTINIYIINHIRHTCNKYPVSRRERLIAPIGVYSVLNIRIRADFNRCDEGTVNDDVTSPRDLGVRYMCSLGSIHGGLWIRIHNGRRLRAELREDRLL